MEHPKQVINLMYLKMNEKPSKLLQNGLNYNVSNPLEHNDILPLMKLDVV